MTIKRSNINPRAEDTPKDEEKAFLDADGVNTLWGKAKDSFVTSLNPVFKNSVRMIANGGSSGDVTTVAQGIGCVSLGYNTKAYGMGAVAEGDGAVSGAQDGSTNGTHAEGSGVATGDYSHAEGVGTSASGYAAHSEGATTSASGEEAHAEGNTTTASGRYSHAEGLRCRATGDYSHAEGSYTETHSASAHSEGATTRARGVASHAEGYGVYADGDYSHAEGKGSNCVGNDSHAEGHECMVFSVGSHAEGWGSIAGDSSMTASDSIYGGAHAEGGNTKAYGQGTHAEGIGSQAYGGGSHAEGYQCKAGNDNKAASINGSHAEGRATEAAGQCAHSEGISTIANGNYSHAGGQVSVAASGSSFAHGYYVTASQAYEAAFGSYNVLSTSSTQRFVVGSGTASARSNCFRVMTNAVYGTGAYNSTGADYAEMFEWKDGNPVNEDRCGRFVTLEGEYIRLAQPSDDFILGVVSGAPSVIGDVHDDQWKGMYETDIFGRPVFEVVDIPAVTEEVENLLEPGQKFIDVIEEEQKGVKRLKLNPDYDSEQDYVPRSERPEWDAVGMLGKLVMVDDGTCLVDHYCKVGNDGVATKSTEKTRFRVMAQLDSNHIRVLILPS